MPGHLHGHGVSELAHDLAPRAAESVLVRECLKSRSLPRCEIPHRSIGPTECVFSSGDSVNACLECLGGFVHGRPSVADVGTCSRIAGVVKDRAVLLEIQGIWEASESVAHRAPARLRRRIASSYSANPTLQYLRDWLRGQSVLSPVGPIDVLGMKEGVT